MKERRNAAGGIQDARFATTENGCQYKNIREWTFQYVDYYALVAFISLTVAEFRRNCSHFSQQKEFKQMQNRHAA